jgi:response regulator RpfG family c-di-GMP phosphodiesterase
MTGEQTILYVDDQPSHRTLFQKAFQSRYRIVTAGSGEEGLEIMRQHKILLVIADHNMPGMSGIDFLAKASEIDPRVEKAILSAYLDDGVLKELEKKVVKVTGRFEKPWKMDRIRRYIDKVLEKKSLIESSEWVTLPSDEVTEEAEVLTQTSDPETSRLAEHLNDQKVSYEGLVQLLTAASVEHVPEGAAKRIFSHFVQPRITDDMMTLRPPCSEFLRQAQLRALAGNIDGLESLLSDHFRKEGMSGVISQLMNGLGKVVH